MENFVYCKDFDQQITFGLRVSEFQCSCRRVQCQTVLVNGNFIPAFKKFRFLVDTKLHVLSGFRCVPHNREVRGVKNSTHTKGQAIDVRAHELLELRKLTIEDVIDLAQKAGFLFVKYYPDKGFFHMDVFKRS